MLNHTAASAHRSPTIAANPDCASWTHRTVTGLVLLIVTAVSASLLSASTAAATSATNSPPANSAAKDPLDTVLMQWGSHGKKVRNLKARLVQRKLMKLPFTDAYRSGTVKAVRAFQTQRGIKASGRVDRRTWRALLARTHTPTAFERSGKLPPPPRVPGSWTNPLGKLDSRCTTGLALCIDKRSRTLQWVVNGKVKLGLDVRFGGPATPTREGQFSVFRKSRNHVSSIYHTPMPFSMFFSGGQAVHFSSDFTARGYAGASHGCVNVRDYNGLGRLFDQVPLGTKVIVYWS